MWPLLLDMTKDECKKTLRRLELEAYSNVVSALRAQGNLSTDKYKLLQDVAFTLNIPQERHRAEVRRACNDEKLTTIAQCMTGDDTTDEWALEGRRLVPLMPRSIPQTAYCVIADEEATKASIENEKLPLPASTERERKRPPVQSTNVEQLNKNSHLRLPESSSKAINQFQNNVEEVNNKKRKSNVNMESSSLAQHLMMTQPKISKVQQLYRQKTKALLKSQAKYRHSSAIVQQSVNIPVKQDDETPKDTNKLLNPLAVLNTSISNENQLPKQKPTIIQTAIVKPAIQSTSNLILQQHQPTQHQQHLPEIQPKSIKICPARKVVTTTTTRTQSQSQKVIIVSTSPGSSTSSILQRTLTIPYVKTISMKNLDKVKVLNNTIVTTNVTSPVAQKPKLLTVQTKVKAIAPAKHLNIPFIQGIQLQALQNKGAIKMVPLSTTAKSITPMSKTTYVNTSGSIYIMNSPVPMVTTSNLVPISSPKAQMETDVTQIESQQSNDVKSSVLAEILKASGVLADEVVDQGDIESQITQHTEIPGLRIEPAIAEVTEDETQIEQTILSSDTSNYVIIHENEEESQILLDENLEQSEVVEMMSNLDPETGIYSTKTLQSEESEQEINMNEENSQTEIPDPILLEMESIHSSQLDMPSLSN